MKKCGICVPAAGFIILIESVMNTRTSVRRTQLRSVSAVCVRAAKTAHPQRPSSFPNRRSSRGDLRFGYTRERKTVMNARTSVRRTQLRSVSAVCVRAAKTAHPQRPSSFPNRRSSRGDLRFGYTGESSSDTDARTDIIRTESSLRKTGSDYVFSLETNGTACPSRCPQK